MKSSGVFPFYYPTTVMFVDDNQSYLENLGMKLSERLAYRMYVSPHEALRYLLSQAGEDAPSHSRVSIYGDNPNPLDDHVISLDLRSIASNVMRPGRFAEVSVVAVNYDMPGLNGVELCRQLADSPVKKLLFTGVADEAVAIDAFNEGVIDGFLSKADAQVFERLDALIGELQGRYFQGLSSFVDEALSYDSVGFVRSSAFKSFFEALRRERGVVEYYLTNDPHGLLLADEEGRQSLLAVYSDNDLDKLAALGEELDVASDVIDSVQSRVKVPLFWWGAHENEDDADAWLRHLIPLRKVDGLEGYYWALVDGVAFEEGHGALVSYRGYLSMPGEARKEFFS